MGGLAGSNAGVIRNCSFTGNVSGTGYVGGLVGTNTESGVILNCTSAGEIHGTHFVGGIAGENAGVIRSCLNTAAVNTTEKQNSVELSDITMGTVLGTETISTVTDIGGIVGFSSGTVQDCENRADVGYRQMGYNIGGIAGRHSGYLAGCINYGSISGRKEIGGIAGQQEPFMQLRYDTDALQLLSTELDVLSGLVDQAAQHAEENTSAIRSQIYRIENYLDDSIDVVDDLILQLEDPQSITTDDLVSAFTDLSNNLTGIANTLGKLSSSLGHTTNELTRDLKAITTQIDVIEGLLDTASEHLGGSVSDISDQDNAEDQTSKTENCQNFGVVNADLNAGGIVGAICVESDLDPEEDVQIIGDDSLYAAGTVRSVVLNCVNHAPIASKKQNAGGIIGWQSLGLIKDCVNSGNLDASNADYVGGIAGRSSGYIRFCASKAQLKGSACVGGIAGSGATVSDCHSMTLVEATEKAGAILGIGEELRPDDLTLEHNYYPAIQSGIGAVDGIDYEGCAQSLSLKDFLALEGLAENFQTVTVTFLLDDGTKIVHTLPAGNALKAADIPELPERTGYNSYWEGLQEGNFEALYFDTTIHAVYAAHSTAIQAPTLRENGLPVLLVQGSFTDKATATATVSSLTPQLQPEQTLVEAWSFAVSEQNAVTSGRFLLPTLSENSSYTLMLHDQDGSWVETQWVQDGRYLVFPLTQSIDGLAIVENPPSVWPMVAAGAGVLVLAVSVIVVLCLRKRSRKKASQTQNP